MAGNNITLQVTDTNGGTPLRSVVVVSDGENREIGPVVVAADETVVINFVCDLDLLKSFTLISTKEVTVETNDTGENADDSFTIEDGEALHWHIGSPIPLDKVFTADLVTLHVTNSGEVDAEVSGMAVINPIQVTE